MQAVAERTQVIELAKTLPDEQVNYILQVIQSLPKKNSSRKCGLKGRFASYANSSLRKTKS